jgi:hypothetical protein
VDGQVRAGDDDRGGRIEDRNGSLGFRQGREEQLSSRSGQINAAAMLDAVRDETEVFGFGFSGNWLAVVAVEIELNFGSGIRSDIENDTRISSLLR